MNNGKNTLDELIKGIGMMAELWMITYGSFKNQKLSDEEAMKHTKAYMSIMIHEMTGFGKENDDDQT